MEMKDNHTEMEFKNTIIKRMYKKCVLLFILVICLVILLVGAALGKLWALIGYIGILLVLVYTMHFTSKNPFPFSISAQDYEAILRLLSDSDSMTDFEYIETLYALRPELDKLLYENTKKEEYYRNNLSLLQSLLRHKILILSKEKDFFATKCKDLLKAYQKKSEILPCVYSDFEKSKDKNKNCLSNAIAFLSGNFFRIIVLGILVLYFFYKTYITIKMVCGSIDLMETPFHNIMYNLGAEFIATMTFIIEHFLSFNKYSK